MKASLALLLLILSGQVHANFPSVKGLWVVRDILKSKAETDRMLAFVNDAGVTDLFLQVRGRGDAYYSSRLVPRAEGLAEGWDPLAYVCDKLSGRPVQLHLWLNVYYLWSADKPPLDTTHLFHQQPAWSAVSKKGLSMRSEGTETLKRRGLEGIFISPANDDFSGHFRMVVAELLERYRFHGIHLDYIRFADDDYDYSDAIRSKFILEYHIDPMLSSESSAEWTAFRKRQVSTLVDSLSRLLKTRDSSLVLTAAVWADTKQADRIVLQDWPSWIQTHLLDFVVLMNYAVEDPTFDSRLSDALGRAKDGRRIVCGISLYNQDAPSVKRKIAIARNYALRGLCYFSYETIRTEKKIRDLFGRFP